MPATVTPTSYLPGLKLVTSDGSGAAAAASFANSKTYLCINLDDVPELTGAEANPSTGDMRKIVFALEQAIYDAMQAITTADRPAKWANNRQSSVNDSSDVVSRVFVNQFSTEIAGEEVADE
jgi:hypothetical protein